MRPNQTIQSLCTKYMSKIHKKYTVCNLCCVTLTAELLAWTDSLSKFNVTPWWRIYSVPKINGCEVVFKHMQ